MGISRPAPARNSVVDIVEKHVFKALSGFRAAVKDKAETPVDHFTPADPSAIVNGYPGGSPETVPDNIVYGHVGRKPAAVVNIAGLPEWTVRPTYIVVIPAQNNRAGKFPFFNGLVKG